MRKMNLHCQVCPFIDPTCSDYMGLDYDPDERPCDKEFAKEAISLYYKYSTDY